MILFYGTGGVPGGGEMPMEQVRYLPLDDFPRTWGVKDK